MGRWFQSYHISSVLRAAQDKPREAYLNDDVKAESYHLATTGVPDTTPTSRRERRNISFSTYRV